LPRDLRLSPVSNGLTLPLISWNHEKIWGYKVVAYMGPGFYRYGEIMEALETRPHHIQI
jgi:hypothetical protein